MPEIEIQFRSEAEYRRLRAIRDKYGVQWRGMLIQGAKRLEGRELRFALTSDDSERERRQSESNSTDPSEQPVESSTDAETHETPVSPDTSTTDHRLDPSLFDANGTLRTVESETNHREDGVAEFAVERAER
ncbi:hypothetical protein DU504_16275 [Haloplanus salinus]|jgi:hypothetical protein|uniref:Uncharacterized protein n=1 Tax=Haloplanus salinus TaxID=1126245 RepID=A0A368N1D4_9EURY|nr:hypothetical protein [Haloplanus salinus]RCU44322.1 hypothetical protein DU504_16275 [Haloplanus salinus]